MQPDKDLELLEKLAILQPSKKEKEAVDSLVYQFIINLGIYAGYDKTQFGPCVSGKKVYAYFYTWLLKHNTRQFTYKYAPEYKQFIKEFAFILKQRSPEFSKINDRYFRLTRKCFAGLKKLSKDRVEQICNLSKEREKRKQSTVPRKSYDPEKYQELYKEKQKKRSLEYYHKVAKHNKPKSTYKPHEYRRKAVIKKSKEFFAIRDIKAAFDAQKSLFYGNQKKDKDQS